MVSSKVKVLYFGEQIDPAGPSPTGNLCPTVNAKA